VGGWKEVHFDIAYGSFLRSNQKLRKQLAKYTRVTSKLTYTAQKFGAATGENSP
jgi:hypothetical protein